MINGCPDCAPGSPCWRCERAALVSQVESIQQERDGLLVAVESLQGYLAEAENKADTAERQVESLQGQLGSLEQLVARRPALDKPTLYENVAHAIHCAGANDDRANRAEVQLRIAESKVEELRGQLTAAEQRATMQLAAISTLSIANTHKSLMEIDLSPEHEAASTAFFDVHRAISREIRERERAEAAEQRIRELEEAIREHAKRWGEFDYAGPIRKPDQLFALVAGPHGTPRD